MQMQQTTLRALPIGGSQQPLQSLIRPARRHSDRHALRTQATSAPLKEMVQASEETSVKGLNKISRTITQPKSQGASQAMLYATGLTKEDLDKPQVGISSVWYEGNPCNMHLMDLAAEVKAGVEEANMVGFRFNTVGVSDAISMGTDGMSFSLQSRDLIADSIETVMGAQWYDANISLPGCDKNMPGTIIAMARLNRPSIMIYGGTIRAGFSSLSGQPLDVVAAFQSYGSSAAVWMNRGQQANVVDHACLSLQITSTGSYTAGLMSEEERADVVRHACPGAGACGGMYTANTMASAIEALGMSLPYSSSVPAEDSLKKVECRLAGRAVLELLRCDITPRDIMTRKAFENAIVTVMALGGSTNAVLHLLAMAHAVDVPLTLDDFQTISDRTPFIADLKPSGRYVMEDLHKVGGIPGVLKYLLSKGLLHGECMTVTGKTLAENLDTCRDLDPNQTIIKPLESPVKPTGHIQILYGNISPDGCVGKITGKEGLAFEGPAKVYDSEEDMIAALAEDPQSMKGAVIVIRFEGPKGGPGMPEMLTPTSAIIGAGLGDHCALITDGRFSGGSHGFVIGHITPEAQEGGPIALVREGDVIRIDAETKTISAVNVSDQEWEQRRSSWQAPPYKATRGTLYKYLKNVSSASTGCVTDV